MKENYEKNLIIKMINAPEKIKPDVWTSKCKLAFVENQSCIIQTLRYCIYRQDVIAEVYSSDDVRKSFRQK